MFETLEKKGDEAAELSSRLIELKNQMLDMALFENKFLATRVALSELPLSPNLQASLKAAEKAGKDVKKTGKAIQRKDLIISCVQDRLREGEYFLQLESKEDNPISENMMDLLSPKNKPANPGYEKKMIPALDIKNLESLDSLTFSIILHDECLLNSYDETITKPSAINKTKNRAS